MEIGRSSTFVVGSDRQQGTLDVLQRREQHLSEQYTKNKPLCFNAKAYQKTHPLKARRGRKDADATLASPMLCGVADGVSQIEDFGIDASLLPNELLNAVEEQAINQLLPELLSQKTNPYLGPISMMREAYEQSESLGSTTILLAILDNSSRIHGKLHPMVAILSIGDCEILILRREEKGKLASVFHTEMQRINGHAQSPLQVARVDDSVDPLFSEDIALDVIERGSAVHFVSAFEGDLVILGSDGVFDNLFLDEIVSICEERLPPSFSGAKFVPADRNLLGQIARRIVEASHAKTVPDAHGNRRDTPIGKGGKMDDTSCVVGEVVEWTDEHEEAWNAVRNERKLQNLFTCGGAFDGCGEDESDEEAGALKRNYPSNPNGSFSTLGGSFASLPGSSRYGGSVGSQPEYRNGPMSRRGPSERDGMCSIS